MINFLNCKPNMENKSSVLLDKKLKQKIGQMVMVGFRDDTVTTTSPIYQLIKDYNIGGVVLYNKDLPSNQRFKRNVVSPNQLKSLNTNLQAINPTPLLIGIDEEGGMVSRLNSELGFQNHYSQQFIGQLDDIDSTKIWADSMAKELSGLGININFGPVVDLNINPKNPIIGGKERSFSDSLDVVLKHSLIFIDAHEKQKVLCTPKHFPGHGSSYKDSHKGLADVTDTWDEKELIPFKKMIQKTNLIMTSHVYNANLDTLPATISPKIIQGLLREEFKFDGVIISDDMQMRAISNFYDFETSIEKAILAGVDILLFSNNAAPCPEVNSDCVEIQYDEYLGKRIVEHIYKLVKTGKIPKHRIENSYERIMELKQRLKA